MLAYFIKSVFFSGQTMDFILGGSCRAGNRRKGKESSGNGWKEEKSEMRRKGKRSVHPPAIN